MTNRDTSAILILVDALRPDAIPAAPTPVIDGLVATGASTFTARTVMPSVSLPCITSLFLGAPPEVHGVVTNTWSPPPCPTTSLFEAVKAAGGRTASFYNWEPLRDLAPPDNLDLAIHIDNSHDPGGTGDTLLAETAARWLGRETFTLAFVYLGHVDVAGHDHGHMSPRYLEAVANADRCIGTLLDALPEETAVVVLADHGGHDKGHGEDCDEDMTIPVIVRGPSIPAGHAIKRPVSIVDVAPTVARLLGLEPPPEWTGEPLP